VHIKRFGFVHNIFFAVFLWSTGTEVPVLLLGFDTLFGLDEMLWTEMIYA